MWKSLRELDPDPHFRWIPETESNGFTEMPFDSNEETYLYFFFKGMKISVKDYSC